MGKKTIKMLVDCRERGNYEKTITMLKNVLVKAGCHSNQIVASCERRLDLEHQPMSVVVVGQTSDDKVEEITI